MDARTLSKAMGGVLSLARHKALLPAFNAGKPGGRGQGWYRFHSY